LHLEENSIFRGYGWYRAAGFPNSGSRGFLVRSGADILSLYLDNNYLGTLVPGGGDAYIPLPDELEVSSNSNLVVRAEIWGHANFDDHRLPALRLNSMKGIAGLVVVHKAENITPNWFYQHRAQVPVQQIDLFWPLIYFGGWSTTDEPQRGVYYREVCFEKGMDARVLSFPGLQVNAHVYLNGQQAGMVNPFSPFLDVSLLSRSGESATISVVVEQNFRRPAGQVVLYEGRSLREWEVAGWNDIDLQKVAKKYQYVEKAIDFPISLKGGEMALLHIHLPTSLEWEKGRNLKFFGQGIKISAWIGRHMIGRVWLPSDMRPHMAGGADNLMILPAAWLHEGDGQLWLMLESVSQDGELSSVNFAEDA
jgi:beta-galactosidase